MKKAKTIKIFPAPHVEVRIHVSKEMEEDYKKCYLSGRMYRCEKSSWMYSCEKCSWMYSCEKCSWDNVRIGEDRVCCLEYLERGIRLPLRLEQE